MPLIQIRFHPELPSMMSPFDVLPHLTCYFMCCSTLKLALAIFIYSRDQGRKVHCFLRKLANAGSV
jgi:hypothetical protein